MQPIKPTNRQQEIIATAAYLFREQGYLATSIRDISERLGMTSAALYYHFKNKEEILLEIMRLSLHNLREAVQTAVDGQVAPWNKLRAALRTHLAISVEYQDFAIVLLKDLRHLSADERAHVVAARDAYEDMWQALLEECAAEGLFRQGVDLDLLRLMAFGALNLVVTWYKPEGKLGPEEIADAFLEFMGQGVLHPATASLKFA